MNQKRRLTSGGLGRVPIGSARCAAATRAERVGRGVQRVHLHVVHAMQMAEKLGAGFVI